VNEEILHRGKEKRNILRINNRKKANWTDHILRRNSLLKLERKIEERERQRECVCGLEDEKEEVGSYWMT